MAFIDINKLIHEHISTKLSEDSSTTISESYINSVVEQISQNEGININTVCDAFPEIFENKSHIETLYAKLCEKNIIVEGFNDSTNEESEEVSPILSVIASGVSVKKYLNSTTK